MRIKKLHIARTSAGILLKEVLNSEAFIELANSNTSRFGQISKDSRIAIIIRIIFEEDTIVTRSIACSVFGISSVPGSTSFADISFITEESDIIIEADTENFSGRT